MWWIRYLCQQNFNFSDVFELQIFKTSLEPKNFGSEGSYQPPGSHCYLCSIFIMEIFYYYDSFSICMKRGLSLGFKNIFFVGQNLWKSIWFKCSIALLLHRGSCFKSAPCIASSILISEKFGTNAPVFYECVVCTKKTYSTYNLSSISVEGFNLRTH